MVFFNNSMFGNTNSHSSMINGHQTNSISGPTMSLQHGGNSLSSSPRSSTSSSSSSSIGSLGNFGHIKQRMESNNHSLSSSHQNGLNGYQSNNGVHNHNGCGHQFQQQISSFSATNNSSNKHSQTQQQMQNQHHSSNNVHKSSNTNNNRQQSAISCQIAVQVANLPTNMNAMITNGNNNNIATALVSVKGAANTSNNSSLSSNTSNNNGTNGSSNSSTNNNNNSNSSRYKTELCRPFEESGFCKYSDKCQYAHGPGELRSLQRHPKYKTELCRTFHTTGFCPYGPRCHFIHNNDVQSTKAKDVLLDVLGSVASVNTGTTVTNSVAGNSVSASCASSNGSVSLPLTPTSPTSSNGELALQLASPALITPQMSPQSNTGVSSNGSLSNTTLVTNAAQLNKLQMQLVALQQQKQQQQHLLMSGVCNIQHQMTSQLSPPVCKSDELLYKYI